MRSFLKVAVVVTLSACGGSDDGGPSGPNNPGGGNPNAVNISMVNSSFSPQQVEVAIGGTVRFTNNDAVQHNATAPSFATGNMNPGQAREQVLSTAGTISYECTLHPGMSGSIVVR